MPSYGRLSDPDSFQNALQVSIPVLYPPQEIIDAAERFYYASETCSRSPTATASTNVWVPQVRTQSQNIKALIEHSRRLPDRCPCSFFEA
jgi:hypothetical protein